MRATWISLLVLLLVTPVCASVDCNGSTAYIDTGTTGIPTAAPMTISVWVKFDTQATGEKIVARWDDTGTDYSFLLQIDTTASDELRFLAHDSGSALIYRASTSGANLGTGTWYNVVANYDDVGDVDIYVDGTDYAGSTTSFADTLSTDTTMSFCAGQNGASRNGHIDGEISDVAIWSSVLTTAQSQLIANSKMKRLPLQIATSNLTGYWPLDEGSTTNLDYKQNNNGTGTNTTATPETILSYP